MAEEQESVVVSDALRAELRELAEMAVSRNDAALVAAVDAALVAAGMKPSAMARITRQHLKMIDGAERERKLHEAIARGNPAEMRDLGIVSYSEHQIITVPVADER